MGKVTIRMGEPFLWIEKDVALDGANGSATSWTQPLEEYLPFGDANQATFGMELSAIGPGSANVTFKIERSLNGDSESDVFEDMGSSFTLARNFKFKVITYGRENVSDKSPRGLCRVKLSSAAAGDNWCIVRMRVWVTLQEYPAMDATGRGLQRTVQWEGSEIRPAWTTTPEREVRAEAVREVLRDARPVSREDVLTPVRRGADDDGGGRQRESSGRSRDNSDRR
jgi:hypothetical protein